MTTLIEALLVDRLIQQVERRTRAEAEASDNARSLTISEGRAVDFQRELDRAKEAAAAMEALADRRGAQVNDMIRSRDDAEKRLLAFYEKAEALERLLARRRNTHPIEAAVREMREAMRAAHDDCGNIPF